MITKAQAPQMNLIGRSCCGERAGIYNAVAAVPATNEHPTQVQARN